MSQNFNNKILSAQIITVFFTICTTVASCICPVVQCFMGFNSLVKCYYIYLCASVRPIRIDINYYNYNCKQYGNFVVYYNVCIKISASYHLVYIQHVNTLFKQIICTYVYQIRVFFIHMVHGKLYSLLLNLSCYPCTYTANVSFSYAIFYYSYI